MLSAARCRKVSDLFLKSQWHFWPITGTIGAEKSTANSGFDVAGGITSESEIETMGRLRMSAFQPLKGELQNGCVVCLEV